MAEGGETQILKGSDFSVTDREIKFAGGAVATNDAAAAQLDNATTKTTVLPTLLTIAAAFILIGAVVHFPPLWIAGLALAAFSPVLKINRPAFAVSVETGGARKVVYTTANEDEAKLALAAVDEALRRAKGTNEGMN
ncbi:MAG: hypothetical protein ABL871_04645 [Terricaulis sp.]